MARADGHALCGLLAVGIVVIGWSGARYFNIWRRIAGVHASSKPMDALIVGLRAWLEGAGSLIHLYRSRRYLSPIDWVKRLPLM